MFDIDEGLAEYKGALDVLEAVRSTMPVCRPANRGKSDKQLDAWQSTMTTVYNNARQAMVTYVVALLHGHAARLREFELFIVGTKLTDCLEQNAISELLVQVFNLGEGNGIGWLEKAVTGEMGTNEYMPPLRAEFTVVNQRINIVLVDMRDQELSLKLRLDGCGVLF